MWPKETDGAYCATNFGILYEEHWFNKNQLECQELCTAKATCVGISYMDRNCRLCEDDKLYDDDRYDFYRRPG